MSDDARPQEFRLRRVRAALIFAFCAALYVGKGWLPGRVLLPLDLLSDTGAWKPDPTVRVPVSNHLLSDAVLQFEPWDVEARRLIGKGQFPWINPLAGFGAPLWANPHAALLSPVTALRLIFSRHGWAFAVFLKLLLSGLGMRWLVIELGGGELAALISGGVFLGCGYSVLWALHPHTNVCCLLPALLASVLAYRRSPGAAGSIRIALIAAAATAGGHPETLAMGVIACAVFFVWDTRRSRSPQRLRRSVLAGLAASAGFLLLSVQLVPFFRLLPETRTVEVRRETTTAGWRPFAVLGELLPGFAGSPLQSEIDLTGAIPGSENFNARSSAYVGALSLVLLAMGWRTLSGTLRRCVVVGVVGLLFAFRFPPLEALFRHIPGIRLAAPEWISVVAALFLAAATGPALIAVARLGARRWPAAPIAAVGALLIAGGLALSAPAARPFLQRTALRKMESLRSAGALRLPATVYRDRMVRYVNGMSHTAIRRAALPGIGWLLFGAGLAVARRRILIIGAGLAVELASFGIGYLPAVKISDIPPEPRWISMGSSWESWSLAAAPDLLPPNLSTLYGARDVRSFDLLETRPYLGRLAACGYDANQQAFPSLVSQAQVECLGRLGVRYYLDRSSVPGATRVGGRPPPEPGLYELAHFTPSRTPAQAFPPGFGFGVVLSSAALLLTAAVAAASTRLDLRNRAAPRP